MGHVHAINCIQVPQGMVEEAMAIRDTYVAYFKRQPGFVSACFYRAATATPGGVNFINIVVWESKAACDAVVGKGYDNVDGENEDGMKVLGKGFPPPIKIDPGLFTVVAQEAAAGEDNGK